MKIKIIRGQNQIGGSIIKISTNNTKLYFDIGSNLDEDYDNAIVPEVEGLFNGTKDTNGVFISHYHSDHLGLIDKLLPGIDIYMGEECYKIIEAKANYFDRRLSFKPLLYHNQDKIVINDITITPILCDHSAYDSYMFLIEADNKKILYTGDYRANGRMSFNDLLAKLPRADALITEGTVPSRNTDIENITEDKLEEIGSNYIANMNTPVFMLTSAMNIDRLKTVLNIARRANRILLMDLYTASITSVLKDKSLSPYYNKDILVFMNTNRDSDHDKIKKYWPHSIKRENIVDKKYIMLVNANFSGYLESLDNEYKKVGLNGLANGVLFYGLWQGYMEGNDKIKSFLSYINKKNIRLHRLHTSGHADSKAIDRLVARVEPKYIIPVHTTNPEWFNKYSDIGKIIIDENEIEI